MTRMCSTLQLLRLLLLLCVCLRAARAQTLPLPRGVQVEGVAHAAGTLFFAAQFRLGGVLMVDTATGLVTTVVPPAFDRAAVGMAQRNGSLYVAGAGFVGVFRVPPRMFVYDVRSGETLRACDAPMRALINDVAVDDRFAYFTDTLLGNVYALPVNSGKCDFDTIPLPRDSFPEGSGAFSANGIVRFASGLVVANIGVGSLFFVDLDTNATQRLLPDGAVPGADGLELQLDPNDQTQATLYLAQSMPNLISVWRLSVGNDRRVGLQFVRNVTSSLFDTPSTLALGDGTLLVANGRFMDFPLTVEVPDDALFELVALRVGAPTCSL